MNVLGAISKADPVNMDIWSPDQIKTLTFFHGVLSFMIL